MPKSNNKDPGDSGSSPIFLRRCRRPFFLAKVHLEGMDTEEGMHSWSESPFSFPFSRFVGIFHLDVFREL